MIYAITLNKILWNMPICQIFLQNYCIIIIIIFYMLWSLLLLFMYYYRYPYCACYYEWFLFSFWNLLPQGVTIVVTCMCVCIHKILLRVLCVCNEQIIINVRRMMTSSSSSCHLRNYNEQNVAKYANMLNTNNT